MRKLILTLVCMVLLATSAFAAQTQVSSLTADVVVSDTGTASVTATAVVNFSGAAGDFIFPLALGADNITASGGTVDIREVDGVTCAVFSSPVALTGKQTFVCTYTVPYCVRQPSDDTQRFTLRLPEQGWQHTIDQFSLAVTFPAEIEAHPAWESGYYSDVIDNYLTIQVTGAQVTAEATIPLADHETLEMTLDFPDGTFDLSNLPGQTVAFGRSAFYVVLLAAIVYWAMRLRSPRLGAHPVQSIGMETSAGEIPCQLFGQMPELGGLLAHWGNLGYIVIERDVRGRIVVYKQIDMGNERNPSERRVFHALFRGSDRFDAQNVRVAEVLKECGGAIRGQWLRRMFDRRGGNPYLLRGLSTLAGALAGMIVFDQLLPATGIRWLLLPLLALVAGAGCLAVQALPAARYRRRPLPPLALGCSTALALLLLGSAADCLMITLLSLGLQLLCGWVTMFGGRRSAAGREQLRRLLGLRKFLRRADRQALETLCRQDPSYFYHMLPYAEAMGIVRAYVARFGPMRIEPCPWLIDADQEATTTGAFLAQYDDIFRNIRGEMRRGSKPEPQSRRPAAAGSRHR